jgi:hypothetical protein
MQPPDSVDRLQRLMIDGGEKAFDLVPYTLANVIKERQWAGKHDKHGVPFQSFEAFVTHKLWHGLESSIDDLLVYCRKRPEVERLIRAELPALTEHGEIGGGHSRGDNITSGARGTSPTYALRRLKRDRPDLAERVVNGELSANSAAIEAGFRKPTITVSADLDAAISALIKRHGLGAVVGAVERARAA